MTNRTISVKDKIVVVTGALGLLGNEYVDVLSREGSNVIITDTNQKKCEELAIKIKKRYSIDCLGLGLDVTDKKSIDNALKKILSKYTRVDALINNAALNNPSKSDEFFYTPFEKLKLEDWDRMLNVNLTGPFLCCQVFGEQMAKQGGGTIINVSSTYGIVAPDQRLYKHFNKKGGKKFIKPIAYSVSKAGIIMLTKYLAAYWGVKNVRVNALVPGGVYNNHNPFFKRDYSNKTPLGRMADKKDYNGAIIYLISDSSSYMTGACLVVDGGWTIW